LAAGPIAGRKTPPSQAEGGASVTAERASAVQTEPRGSLRVRRVRLTARRSAVQRSRARARPARGCQAATHRRPRV